MNASNDKTALPHQCEFTCQGCGAKAPGVFYGHGWNKPNSWFERSDDDGVQTVCSRECIAIVARCLSRRNTILMPSGPFPPDIARTAVQWRATAGRN